ncbi:MAG: ribosomal RNA small subunit methyltransferase A [Gemmatimonadetes bacterium]|nr:ribosomal RNA small subunit methyltransferase A [Gemmatimonadota bacterium]
MASDEGAKSRRAGFPPTRKSLGQHFLTDRRILGRIADALHLKGDETVLEIGPGRGALTDLLAERAGRLIAIEYDRALAAMLRERYARRSNVLVAEADVLEVSLGELAAGPYVLVGNVPYYITTPILFHALVPPRADRAVYLVQREVAQRLVASPGGKEYGALTVNVGAVARAETLFGVPSGAFSPPPKVESAVVRITPLAQPLISQEEERPFRTLVQGAFGMRRKQMRRVVRSLYALDAAQADALLAAAGIEPADRPEVLSVGQFVALLRGAGKR